MQALQMTMMFILPSVFFSGFIFPRETMPWIFYAVGSVLPATYFIDLMRAIILRGAEWVIVDEIYAALTYDGFEQRSLLELAPALRDRLVVVDGVSKRFAMTGYRVGWMLANRELARACEAIQSQATTSIAALSQHAAIAALSGPQAPVAAMRDVLQVRRDSLLARLSAPNIAIVLTQTSVVIADAWFVGHLGTVALASLAVGYPDAVDGGVHGAGFYVLAGARMPAVLFETSFVSNGVEEARLATDRYRQKLADGIVNAVRAYRAGY